MDLPISLNAVLPELVMLVAGCVALLWGLSSRESVRAATPWVCLVGIVGAGILLRFFPVEGVGLLIQGGLRFDSLGNFVRIVTLILGVMMLFSLWYEAQRNESGEFFSMFMFALIGLMLVGPSANLVVLFLALEVLSIPSYIMVVLSRTGSRSLESGTKYFYLGAMAAAITAMGFCFLFGVAGQATMDSVAIDRIYSALNEPGSLQYGLATIGVVLSIGGLLFKIAAFPLHFYVADVYEGAASPVAGMLGFLPKFAGIVAIMKIVSYTGWQTGSGSLFWMFWIVAAASMTIGNVMALRQDNIKRMLAYSGVGHAGYMLIGIMAGPTSGSIIGDGNAAVLYYVVIYGIANLGAFAVLGLLRVRGRECETVADVAGLVRRFPGLAILLALSMFALMGLPPTTGFWGKMSLFGSGMAMSGRVDPELRLWVIGLVVIAAINSAIGAAYYLRVIGSAMLSENEETAEPLPREAQYMGALMCGFLTLALTFAPAELLKASSRAAQNFHFVRDEGKFNQVRNDIDASLSGPDDERASVSRSSSPRDPLAPY